MGLPSCRRSGAGELGRVMLVKEFTSHKRVWFYGETFPPNTIRLVVGSVAFAKMCVAVAELACSAPATMDPGPTLTAAST